MVEFVVAHPQAVARLAGVDRVGIIGEGVAHGLEAASRASSSGLQRDMIGPWQKGGRLTASIRESIDLHQRHFCPSPAH